MRRFWIGSVLVLAALAAAMAATLPTTLGFELWHYNVAFLATGLAAALWRPLWLHRRAATLATALMGALATATGLVMVYTKDFPYKEWLTWWHCVTSVALLLAFLAHWWHNNARLWTLTKRLFEPRERIFGALALLAWVALLAAGAWTAAPGVRERFTRENYLYVVSWTVLAGVVLAYGPWLAYRLPALRARLARRQHRNRARGLVDASLFLGHWAALLTGFALLWLAEPLRAGDFKYVSKWWHMATSVAFLALVALHVGFNARILAAHAERVDKDLR